MKNLESFESNKVVAGGSVLSEASAALVMRGGVRPDGGRLIGDSNWRSGGGGSISV